MAQLKGKPLGAGPMGWRLLRNKPKYSNDVKGEINVLDEMELLPGRYYVDKDDKVRHLIFFNYPEGCINKFTTYKGSEHHNRQGVAVDTRMYKTMDEAPIPNCRVVCAIMKEDGTDKPSVKLTPSAFAKMMGWKKGDGPIEPLPKIKKDEAPADLHVEIAKEAERRAQAKTKKK
jgi:hypothetical protein